MWRLQRSLEGDMVVLQLSGRIEDEQLVELGDIFAAEACAQKIVLDLAGVKLVDQNAVEFLACRQSEGTLLRNCPAYIHEWIARTKDGKVVG
jgi:ABC-type transporter Mla MlaB component